MTKVTWLGDTDPSAVLIEQFGHTFIKGEPTDIPAKDEATLKKLKDNPLFSTDSKAEPAKADDAEIPEETGTERAALRDQLRLRGVTMQGNPSVETLRAKLAETAK